MTPKEIAEARSNLGLTLEALATLLGFTGNTRKATMWNVENGRRNLTASQERLLRAYLAGYRSDDWPDTGCNAAKGLDL